MFVTDLTKNAVEEKKAQDYIKSLLENMPIGWLSTTTHRLDIYNEALAKVEFLEHFEVLYTASNTDAEALAALPTAYDYIRLGHPLSCVLEWTIAKLTGSNPNSIISFSSTTIGVLAVLRKNLLENKESTIWYSGSLPVNFNSKLLKEVYGYTFNLQKVNKPEEVTPTTGSNIFIAETDRICAFKRYPSIDFIINTNAQLGSILLINGEQNEVYISDVQHVRRRETIAMTPANCYAALRCLLEKPAADNSASDHDANKKIVVDTINEVTDADSKVLVGSSGLSIQYAIMMGLVDDALEKHPGKAIKFVVPPNCYGGTNDQARRVAACIPNVEVVDLPVDGDNDMVKSVDKVLNELAQVDAVPYIIAEIPTNPRVEVPELLELKAALSKVRHTSTGSEAITPVFILDQTFCPNVHFLGEGEILSTVRSISYASGSKFPSGGLVTAGYCVGNAMAQGLMAKAALHLDLCDNEATSLQYEVLAKHMPSMTQRIKDAYANTREFVNYIHKTLPEAKINFVSEELASQGFTPSVFSLDLPTKGETELAREAYKRKLNHRLINLMITKIPKESKYCVSYGQLKGCYWTIPATSTQGTTKEGDKDYIARVSVSGNLDLALHKEVFAEFVASI